MIRNNWPCTCDSSVTLLLCTLSLSAAIHAPGTTIAMAAAVAVAAMLPLPSCPNGCRRSTLSRTIRARGGTTAFWLGGRRPTSALQMLPMPTGNCCTRRSVAFESAPCSVFVSTWRCNLHLCAQLSTVLQAGNVLCSTVTASIALVLDECLSRRTCVASVAMLMTHESAAMHTKLRQQCCYSEGAARQFKRKIAKARQLYLHCISVCCYTLHLTALSARVNCIRDLLSCRQ